MGHKAGSHSSVTLPLAPKGDPLAPKSPACQPSHHKSPDKPLNLGGETLKQHLEGTLTCPALRLVGDTVEPTTISNTKEERDEFAKVATTWELKNSAVILRGPAIPIVDEADTVLLYLLSSRSSATYVYKHQILDIDGVQIDVMTTEKALEPDDIGNELAALVVTLGGSFIVRQLAKAIAARVGAAAVAKAVSSTAAAAANAISSELGRATLLFLRSLRAKALVKSLEKRGLKVIVNLGGEAAPHEMAKLGEHIAVNHAVRFPKTKRFVPNLIKESADSLGDLFSPNTVDRIVCYKLEQTFDPMKVAAGAAKVLKHGAKLELNLFSHDPGFATRLVKALADRQFTNIENIANASIRAVKL
ncbi:MAG TPA: hypothetical protein VEQ63_13465 [Bryobacteraceae bacterium]|nr:hypothetical protein [Bryobacteraceae bacterium]